ncbi:MAG: hypothetical protein FWD93_06135, partial [Coriobacteriia bacterium]|nr:hypothetical protein [Coriobacteriia bacterium]
MSSQSPLLDKILSSEKLALYGKFWYGCFAFAMIAPLFGPERVLILVGIPLFLLMLNAYVHIMFAWQKKGDILNKNALSIVKFFLYGGNSFLTFCLLPLGAIIFIPGALNEMGAYLVMPFTVSTLIASTVIYIVTLSLTAFGGILSVIKGRQALEEIG